MHQRSFPSMCTSKRAFHFRFASTMSIHWPPSLIFDPVKFIFWVGSRPPTRQPPLTMRASGRSAAVAEAHGRGQEEGGERQSDPKSGTGEEVSDGGMGCEVHRKCVRRGERLVAASADAVLQHGCEVGSA